MRRISCPVRTLIGPVYTSGSEYLASSAVGSRDTGMPLLLAPLNDAFQREDRRHSPNNRMRRLHTQRGRCQNDAFQFLPDVRVQRCLPSCKCQWNEHSKPGEYSHQACKKRAYATMQQQQPDHFFQVSTTRLLR
jgi:hypothetical protein|uniref:Uncharacterized protein n=1 Tax=Zea mays TaxID=4577 RepID=A0A804PYE6_MAIZE